MIPNGCNDDDDNDDDGDDSLRIYKFQYDDENVDAVSFRYKSAYDHKGPVPNITVLKSI